MSSNILEAMTGPVRVSGYARKIRRVLNRVFRDMVRKGDLDTKTLNEYITELNRRIFKVLVEKYRVPKEAVTNIRLKVSLVDSKLVVKDIQVDVYDIDEILSRNITDELKNEFDLS